jgi:hypothetical protein
MTNNKQQTAVEWLIEHYTFADLTADSWQMIQQQAKEMEKDQINDAYFQGFEDNVWDSLDDNFNLEYYNETYGGGEQ